MSRRRKIVRREYGDPWWPDADEAIGLAKKHAPPLGPLEPGEPVAFYDLRIYADDPQTARVFDGATLPEGVAASGATMLARAISGTGTGAAYGAAQGASDTPDLTNVPDTASRVADVAHFRRIPKFGRMVNRLKVEGVQPS